MRAEGFPAAVVEAVEALTKREGEDYEALIRRVAPNPKAREVKLADLKDNSDLSRIAEPTDKDRARIEIYRRAIAYLEAFLGADGIAVSRGRRLARQGNRTGRKDCCAAS